MPPFILGADAFLGLTASQWTAVGTIALVLVTATYVELTRRLAKSSKEAATSAEASAKSAERSAAAAESAAHTADRSLLLQAMPVLVGHSARMDGGRAKVDVSGKGLGFQVIATVRQAPHVGDSGPIATVDADIGGSVDLKPGFTVDYQQPYEVELTYYDKVGNPYRTIRNSLLAQESLVQVFKRNDDNSDWIRLI